MWFFSVDVNPKQTYMTALNRVKFLHVNVKAPTLTHSEHHLKDGCRKPVPAWSLTPTVSPAGLTAQAPVGTTQVKVTLIQERQDKTARGGTESVTLGASLSDTFLQR